MIVLYWAVLIVGGVWFVVDLYRTRQRLSVAAKRELADGLARIDRARQVWLSIR